MGPGQLMRPPLPSGGWPAYPGSTYWPGTGFSFPAVCGQGGDGCGTGSAANWAMISARVGGRGQPAMAADTAAKSRSTRRRTRRNTGRAALGAAAMRPGKSRISRKVRQWAQRSRPSRGEGRRGRPQPRRIRPTLSHTPELGALPLSQPSPTRGEGRRGRP